MPAGYSSCGDLVHWLLMCLGCRDERYVNRSGDAGVHPWVSGVNVSRLTALPAYVDARRVRNQAPAPGDPLHVAAPDHVDVLVDANESDGKVTTCDYGQPYGHEKDQSVLHHGTVTMLGKRTLMGWVDIDAIELSESALVPNDFPFGVPDDNPYAEGLEIPLGVP